jgi:hypothetical protein
VDELDRDRVQEVELLAAAAPGRDQVRVLEHLEVFHHAEAGHRQPCLELGQRLPVVGEELVEELPPRRVGERLEHRIHARTICDHLVTCQLTAER